MPLTKYTQADFDALKRAKDGYIHVPEGDWSDVDFDGADELHIAGRSILGEGCRIGDGCRLDDKCVLGHQCVVGDYCKLGKECILGDMCMLGDMCYLDDDCVLGKRCRLGNQCVLGDGCFLGDRCTTCNCCKLGAYCKLGNWCRLGDMCKIGRSCWLGQKCELGDGCSMEGGRVSNATYFIVTNIGSSNDSAYAYCNTATGEIYVRAGCWFGGIDEFIKRVHDVHAGTQHETDYTAFAAFARARFGRYQK